MSKIKGIVVDSHSYTAGLSSHSSETKVWFFPDLNRVAVETVYQNGNVNVVHHGKSHEANQDAIMSFLLAERKKRS